jgi:alpha/beta superfamily hydrolase
MTESDVVLVPGARDVRASLDAAASDDRADATACVVACPPHPQMGGVRSDRRLTATSDALTDAGVDCLRFDYGDWDEGRGEREDARNALRWATDRYDAVGVYGYSFGGAVAILAAASVEVPVHAAAVLAPASQLSDELDAAAAVDDLPCPLWVGYGERDDTVDATPVVEAAERCQQSVVAYASDHHFVGQHETAGWDAAGFLATHLE